MTLKDRIVKLWYELPRFKVSFSIKKYKLDSRAFEWYLFRKKYGFDERELWNLAHHLDDRIKVKYGYPKSDMFLTPSEYNQIFKREEFKDDAKWIYDRIKVYSDYDCPLLLPEFINKSSEQIQEETKKIFSKMLTILKHRAEGNNLVDAEINYVIKYLKHLGW